MATDELLPPACAFAVSVLAEYEQDPEAVPEEAVEAARQHMASCPRCKEASAASATKRKKKKVRRASPSESSAPAEGDEAAVAASALASAEPFQAPPPPAQPPAAPAFPSPLPGSESQEQTIRISPPSAGDGLIDCQQCRQLLPEYAEAMDSGQNVALLYPEVQAHLLVCDTGCLVLLDLFRQEAKANRKYRRRPVRDPFRVMWWEISGFFRGGLVPIAPRALAFGTLILVLLLTSLTAFLAIRWDDARYYHPPNTHLLPTPDGIGLSDGLKIFDACNAAGYQDKRQAAQAMREGNSKKAEALLSAAVSISDTTGCNSAEAAIYREDLRVRLSGHPYGIIVVSFDSGPGVADPQGGTDRHILYAAYTQELVGAYISQEQYNSAQMKIPGAPLLYLVLANTTGEEEGALQIANTVATLNAKGNFQDFGLQVSGRPPILAVLGLAPSRLTEVVLPVLCRAGVPLIAPTASGLFIIDLLTQTSLYRHCSPGFAFIRFSADDSAQSRAGADYAYNELGARNVAIFYDPSNPSSSSSAHYFSQYFTAHRHARIVAQETAVASGLLDANGRPQASRDDLLAGLKDALQAQPRPDLIFAPLLSNDVMTLAEAIAQLPRDQQPILLIGGEFVQPTAIQKLVPWVRQNQLALPRIYVTVSSAARPPSGDSPWPKQFYAAFCTLFASPGSFCSGAAALDQGALLFGDGVEMVALSLSQNQQPGQQPQSNQGEGESQAQASPSFPTPAQLVQRISNQSFNGVSGPIALRFWDNVLVTSTRAAPAILELQQDGSIQIAQ
ncbi:ABC transporter substrate-binding protein [Thermogemmatispora sp.]|uniref:ABC transporter substrate-binding protein n=1 Tax=Thermogemmatispora sp. TaxID=1968838 RepID=UPI001E03C198|nr:ABC transporter substrate-binding protein [Thermogemmatispora sp.]MBX5449283.1 amino acid ABC transporter substrate-binding protein [Thermogemmatispora sp.]